MKFKAKVFIRLFESVSDAAGNAVRVNVNKVAPDIEAVSYTHLTLPTICSV